MKTFNFYKFLVGLIAIAVIYSSCYKDDIWADDKYDVIGAYPVINKSKLNKATYNVKEIAYDTINFFSSDPIDKIELYSSVGGGAEVLYSTTPFVSNYNPKTLTEEAVLSYEVPENTSGKTIVLRSVVVNKNGLTSKDEVITQKNKYDKATFKVN
jgi:hypothetical protein